jgi:hypothetical protein
MMREPLPNQKPEWITRVNPRMNFDGDYTQLIVERVDGENVSLADASWLTELIKDWIPPFVDYCQICDHLMNTVIYIDGLQYTGCKFNLSNIHSVCTINGCMPDLEFRRDNLRQGQKLWAPSKRS